MTIPIVENKNNNKISISGLKNKENKTNIDDNKSETEKSFETYQSEFEKKNNYIIKHNKIPKTRYYLIIPLILVTLLTVFLVFKYQPKIHNIKNYEIQILGKNIDSIDKEKKDKIKLNKIKKFLLENRK